jgi:hypothetical protein
VESEHVFFLWRCDPTRVMASSFLRFLDHTQRRTTVGRTPLDGWSARCRDLYLTTHNTHNRQTSMPPVGFKPTISAGEQLHTYALDCAATGTEHVLPSMILPLHPQKHFHCRSVPLMLFPIYLYASLGWYIIYEAPRSRLNDHLHSRCVAAILPSLHQQYLMTYAASVIL